jgi:hypothetical protein
MVAGRGELAVCAACGGMVELLTGPRTQVRPFSETWTTALRPVFSLQAMALVALFSCAVEFLLRVGPRSWLLGQALELGWILIIVRRAGQERTPFGIPYWDDLETAFAGAFPRLLLSAGFLGGCAAALVELGLQATQILFAVWLLAALTVALLPAALLFACVEGHGARWLAPWNLPAAARLLGRDLRPSRIITVVWVGLLAAKSTQPPLDLGDTHMVDKIVAGAVLHFLALAILTALACVTGHLLLTRAEELGHGEPENWRVFLFPGSVPTGRRLPSPPKRVEAPRAPIELEDVRESLLTAVANGDPDELIERWMRGDLEADALDDESHVKIAQAFAARGRETFAAKLLHALLQRGPGSTVAPRAMVILARLYAERLGNPSEARKLYLTVVERFPGTEAARFAQARITP